MCRPASLAKLVSTNKAKARDPVSKKQDGGQGRHLRLTFGAPVYGRAPPPHTHRHTLGTGRANEEPVKTLMFTEEGTGIHCGLSSVTLQGHFGNRCYRQMRHHFLVQDVADFLQIQYFSTVHGTSFQPSSLNSAQSSSPSLLGSPLFQYFMKLNSRCEPSTQCHTPSCFRSDRPIQA